MNTITDFNYDKIIKYQNKKIYLKKLYLLLYVI